MRAGLDLLLPRQADRSDESVAAFVRRRLGNEILDYIAEPLLSGIYNSDPEMQSLKATFPHFVALETKFRSLIRGVIQSQKSAQPKSFASVFASFKNGMQTLVDALENALDNHIDTAAPVQNVRPISRGFVVKLESGGQFQTKKVLITTQASTTATILHSDFPDISACLNVFTTHSSGFCYLAFRETQISAKLQGFGVLISRVEKLPINAVTIVSNKLLGRAPNDLVLLRVFFGGARNPSIMNRSDDEIIAIVQQELHRLLQISSPPLFTRLFRWMDGNPQYELNHLERLAQAKSMLPAGLFISGSAYEGVGIPDCVRQAKTVARAIFEDLL